MDYDEALGHAEKLSSPIYQPYIVGTEVSIDSWSSRSHQVKGLVLRRRDRVAGGESQVTTTFRDAEVEALAADVIERLGIRGPAVMQVILDADSNAHVIECNCRFGGASTASIAAGLEPFYWSILESREVDLSNYLFHRVRGEVRQVRVPSDVYVHSTEF